MGSGESNDKFSIKYVGIFFVILLILGLFIYALFSLTGNEGRSSVQQFNTPCVDSDDGLQSEGCSRAKRFEFCIDNSWGVTNTTVPDNEVRGYFTCGIHCDAYEDSEYIRMDEMPSGYRCRDTYAESIKIDGEVQPVDVCKWCKYYPHKNALTPNDTGDD